ncbi:MAG: hypothetical protein M1823_002867 [Watsoniomyces obsoletus]|nr:MAG: hypothetical protein M1823_002867 [Watsoniomyces obsoletus]
MSRDPLASTKARKAERKADVNAGLITIKPLGTSTSATSVGGNTGTTITAGAAGGGFKKGGFKSSFVTTATPIAPSASPPRNVLSSGTPPENTPPTLMPGRGNNTGGIAGGGFKKISIGNTFTIESEGGGDSTTKTSDGTDTNFVAGALGNAVVGAGREKEEMVRMRREKKDDNEESDTEDEGYEIYDPRCPTD